MSEIPEDVMETAVAISDDAVELHTNAHINDLRDKIARAILAERERCSKVAAQFIMSGEAFSPADLAKEISKGVSNG